MTGGAGRALDTTTMPKYKCLQNDDGYVKTLVNGSAIAQARVARALLVIVEGPFDAAACLAGGVPCVIALNGNHVRPEWFAGIPKVFIANDADTVGAKVVCPFTSPTSFGIAARHPGVTS
jgi:DNA primase